MQPIHGTPRLRTRPSSCLCPLWVTPPPAWWCSCKAGPATPPVPGPSASPSSSPLDHSLPPPPSCFCCGLLSTPWRLNRLLAHPQPTPLKPANGFPPRASSDHDPQSQPSSRSTGRMSVFCPPTLWTKGPLLFLWGSAEQAPMSAECAHVLVCPTGTSRVPAMCPQHDQG